MGRCRLAFSYPIKTCTHDTGVMGVTCQLWMCCLTTTFTHHHQSFVKHSKSKNNKSKTHNGTWGGGDRHNQRAGIHMKFSFLFVYWLFQQHHANIIPHIIGPCQCTSPCRPTLPWCGHHDQVTHGCSPPHNAVETLGCMLCTPVTIPMTFRSLQGCMVVSIDTCTAIARFIGHFWRLTPAWVGVLMGFCKTTTCTHENPCL